MRKKITLSKQDLSPGSDTIKYKGRVKTVYNIRSEGEWYNSIISPNEDISHITLPPGYKLVYYGRDMRSNGFFWSGNYIYVVINIRTLDELYYDSTIITKDQQSRSLREYMASKRGEFKCFEIAEKDVIYIDRVITNNKTVNINFNGNKIPIMKLNSYKELGNDYFITEDEILRIQGYSPTNYRFVSFPNYSENNIHNSNYRRVWFIIHIDYINKYKLMDYKSIYIDKM